ncbi:CRADD protein, partial [Polypterus senegalus]
MDAKHIKLLRKQRLHLAKQLIVGDTIVQYLYQENILTESHVEEIRSQNTNKKRAIKLLDILPTRGPKAFDTFIDSIQDEYPWIKTKLLDELTRLGDGQTGSAGMTFIQTARFFVAVFVTFVLHLLRRISTLFQVLF